MELREALERIQIGVLIKNLSFSNHSKWLSSIANIRVSRRFFKGIFFFHFKCCIETSLHTKLRSRTCAQSCGQGKLSQSLCTSEVILPNLPLWGAAINNFYPIHTEQGFNASNWTCTAPHIWWVATVGLWLYSQMPSQQVVLDVSWENSSCFNFLFPCHSRERKMRIQLEMGRKWKKTNVIEKKTTQLRSNLDC